MFASPRPSLIRRGTVRQRVRWAMLHYDNRMDFNVIARVQARHQLGINVIPLYADILDTA